MSLSTMPTEILLMVFDPLEFEELVCLLPTCKHVRQVAFYCLSKIVDERIVESIAEFQENEDKRSKTVPIKDLQILRNHEHDMSMGLHIGFTVVDGENKKTSEMSVSDISHFLDLINIGVKTGKMDLLNVEMYISEPVSDNSRFTRLFIALKHYSLTRSPLEFSITSLSTRLKPANMIRLFDTTRLTKMTLFFEKFRWDNWGTDETTKYIKFVQGFKNLLRRVKNLEQLEILLDGPVGFGFPAFPPGLAIDEDHLEELKTAFLALEKLHTLKLNTLLIHPSFFLPVPESVKTLSLAHVIYYSKDWWDEFAKYPFKNLENLELNICGNQECFKQGGVGTHLAPGWLSEGAKGYIIGDVKIRGLKKFDFEEKQLPYLPSDLIPCILKQNPGVEGDVGKRFAKEYSATLIQKCKEELIQAMVWKMFESEVSADVERRFLENGAQEDDLKKCTLDYLARFSGFLTEPAIPPPDLADVKGKSIATDF
ncbi:hypothetical protein TWF718_004343 [Orbilia javanica]|uniref:F-box domain-containing protein n=1 Tax=Orbilia javanica TaxID=47235 RepID=A0AAN8RKX3_9PEZI